MAQNADVNVKAPLIFDGWKGMHPDDKNPNPASLNAKDFIKELKARRATGGWTDPHTFAVISSSFRLNASTWFENQVNLLPAAEFERVTTLFPSFEKLFKEDYHLTKTDRDAINWSELAKQKHNEHVSDYAARVGTGLRTNYVLGMASGATEYPDTTVDAAGITAIAELKALHNNTTPLTDAIIAAFARRELVIIAKCKAEAATNLVNANMRSTLINGLRNAELQKSAHEINRNEENTKKFLFTLETEERRALIARSRQPNTPSASGNGNGHKKQFKKQVHEVCADEDSDDEQSDLQLNSHAHANAVIKKSKKTAPKSTKICNWCKHKGHIESECNKKKSGQPKKDHTLKSSQASAIQHDDEEGLTLALHALHTGPAENSNRGW
jgi:hypothetical protein